MPYASSKSGLLGITRALAAEWAPDIRVNAIGPGYFRTELTEVFYQNPTWCAAMLERIPAGRFGALEDLAGATGFPLLRRRALHCRPAALHRRRLHGVDLTLVPAGYTSFSSPTMSRATRTLAAELAATREIWRWPNADGPSRARR